MNSQKDYYFKNNSPKKFTFNKDVAEVFDDMLERSVPFYHAMQAQILSITQEFAQENTSIYDLGCSTGETIKHLSQNLTTQNITFTGVDYSPEMLKKAEEKCKFIHNKQFIQHDLNDTLIYKNPSVIIMNLVLQFIAPENKQARINEIINALPENGILILIEKIKGASPSSDNLFIKHYHKFKENNGYSKKEIEAKKNALKTVLTPDTLKIHNKRLEIAGFKHIDTFFQWYNFASFIAIKAK